MELRLIAIGQRMPRWIGEGWREFARRMPPQLPLRLLEIPLARRSGHRNIDAVLAEEGQRILAAAGKARIVALDCQGSLLSTVDLALRLQRWMQDGRDVALLIGGPDGLSRDCLAQAEYRWCLSPLTLPHMLVRVIVAEQLYRAWTVLQNHPYHRGG
ncbi:MAG TPA: 23S rRNA (pseudouridine(1915)-N(3))-methyltransferase RlmH [Nitrococcus sp.]|nr:23S rRNA (pseudouridine(1915)-N(3))-methyltransferase RlmH [Nitrococcus sp.]